MEKCRSAPVSRSTVMHRAWAEYRSVAGSRPFDRSFFAASLRYAWQRVHFRFPAGVTIK